MENEDIIQQPDDIEEETGPPPEDIQEETGPPPFFSRVVNVFFSPGELFEKLRDNPVWFWTLLLSGVLIMASTAVIPAEAWDQMMQEQFAQSGQQMPDEMPFGGNLFRIMGGASALFGIFIYAFVLSGLLMILFTFFMGGDGTYKQMLSVVSHSTLISALGAVVTTPLKVVKLDPELTLNLGTFMPFLEEGFLLRFLTMMDLFGLWGFAILAVGITKIDPRRSFGGTFGILLTIFVVIIGAIAYFTG